MEDGRPIYDKALREYREITQTWHPQAQIWALTHGTRIGTFCVAGSSFAILIRMRQFFNLFSQQHLIGTILPCVILPSVGYYVSQDLFINRKIFYGFNSSENRKSFCSTCLETRGSVIQAAASVVAPIVFSFFSCAAASLSYRTFPVPGIDKPRKVFRLVQRALGSFPSTILLVTVANLLIGGFITERMLEQHVLVRTKIESNLTSS